MKKLVSLVSLLLCVLTVFVSCGADSPLKLDKKKLNVSTVKTNFTSAELTTLGEGYTFLQRKNDLALFSKASEDLSSTNFKIVNIKSNTTVKEMNFSATDIAASKVSLSLSSQGPFIVLYQNKTYTLYQADGVTAVGSAKTAPSYVNDCAVIGDTVCRYDTKTLAIKETYSYPAINGAIPSCTGYIYSDYYISKSTTGFTVYDSHYNHIGTFTFPGYAYETKSFVLKNGTVFVQYLIALPFDSDKYDVLVDGAKFDLVQKLISPKKLSEKDIKLDYYVGSVSTVDAESTGYIFKKNIDNLATCYKIENGQYDTNNPVSLSLNKNGKVKLAYDKDFISYSPIGNGYLIGTARSGLRVILDSKLNIVVKGAAIVDQTAKYIVTSNAIYDYNFTKLADLINESVTYQYSGKLGSNLTFTATDDKGNTDQYVFDGAFTKIVDYDENQRYKGTLGTDAYAVATVVDSTTTTKVFNFEKTEVASYAGNIYVESTATVNNETTAIIRVGSKFFAFTAK